jgi:rubrerythrin
MSEEFVYLEMEEVFELAEQIERNGSKFYHRAAERADDEKVKGFLLGLADMEDEHEKVFAKLRADWSGKNLPTPDPGAVVAQYVRTWADREIFGASDNPAEMIAEMDAVQVIRTAIGLEKDSITFYTGIKEYVPEGEGKESIDEIIKEEMSHVVTLAGVLKKIKK